LLLVVSGPSGVGKTTITRALIDRLNAVFSVSLTTRPKTAADVEGRDYFFVSRDEFQSRIDQGDLLEFAAVFGRDFYGTPRSAVDRSLADGKIVILEIDVQGAIQVRKSCPDALLIFVLPPSDEELHSRLRDRARESTQDIERRFSKAQAEIILARKSGVYNSFIVNHDVRQSVELVADIVRKHLADAS
jgi:guanylate kinase